MNKSRKVTQILVSDLTFPYKCAACSGTGPYFNPLQTKTILGSKVVTPELD